MNFAENLFCQKDIDTFLRNFRELKQLVGVYSESSDTNVLPEVSRNVFLEFCGKKLHLPMTLILDKISENN